MSTPMFIRESVLAAATITGNAAAVALPVGPSGATETTEMTLIETVSVICRDYNTGEAEILIYGVDPNAAEFLIAAEVLPEGGAAVKAKKVISLNYSLPVGWGMKVWHNAAYIGAYKVCDVVAFGGTLR